MVTRRLTSCAHIGAFIGIAFVGVALTLAFATSATADIIVQYDFGTGLDSAPPVLTPTTVGSGYASTSVSLNGGLTFNTDPTTYPSVQALKVSTWTPNASVSEASALSGGRYLSFTVNATDPTATLNVDNIAFRAARGGPSTSRAFYLYSSVQGFTAGNAIAVRSDAQINLGRAAFTDFSFALGSQYQNLATPVEFRIYGTTPTGGGEALDFDDLTLLGSFNLPPAMTPEPGSLVLFAMVCAAGSLLLWRRRRKMA